MSPRNNVRLSLFMLVGVPFGIVFSVIWATLVKTSPTVADEERIRGWGTVVRELPATLFFAAVLVAGFGLAIRAGRAGEVDGAKRAIVWHGIALFIVLLIVVNGSTENIMTTRPATVKWLLFPGQIGITAAAVAFSRYRIGRRR